MRRATMLPAAALALLATACVSERTEAQALAQRVRAAGDGVVEMRYATRPGICGNGQRGFSIGRHSYYGESNGNDGRYGMGTCVPGARVRLRVEKGAVTEVRVAVGPGPARGASEERVTDLGEVPSAAAASYFLTLAESGTGGRGSHGAITAAVIADSVSVWQRLYAIAMDTVRASGSVRRDAMFWVSRFAAAKVTGHGEDIAAADDDDRDDRDDTRDAAVFALSQLRGKQGVEPLLTIARTHKDPQLRQKAIFWLGQSGDPRAAELFREILKG
ncbi:MAG: HEAT repeat domain-containing protein [Gemmatimonadaceae bacterium]